ncbi:hypothetical protein [Nocardia xishanensis]|uniref:hypothetical protein n=1 Tax=Nocardia xishanensis TaxID=238964 RepID=UPI00082F0A90|nr:hypothetical protein [Nocardia xishanensis]
MNGVRQIYRGRIHEAPCGEHDDALFLADIDVPLAERIEDGLDQWGRFATVRYWITDTERCAEELTDNLAKIAVGAIDADYTHCYSEYTGYLWTDEELNVGGHDLLDELRTHLGRFAHIEFEYCVEAPNLE